jgi:hypothetical protein
MTRSLRSTAARLGAVLMVAAACLAVPAGRAAAQAAAEPGVIYACYVPATGTVYRIRAEGLPDACGASKVNGRVQPHVPFQWNEQGPVGPQGPAGAGAALDPKVVFFQRNVPIDPTAVFTISQTCPTGRRVLDRGYLLLDASGEPLANPVGVTVVGDEYTQPSPSGFDRTPPATQGRTIYIVNAGPRVVQVRLQMTCALVQ